LNFWDVAVLAPRGIHDATNLCASSLYRGFRNRDILQKPKVIINNETVLPYIVDDSTYPPLINLTEACIFIKGVRKYSKGCTQSTT